MKKLTLKGVKGWLSHDDVLRLEEAAKRPLKYAKNPAKKFSCGDCNYNWLYSSMKCPVCSSSAVKNIG